jgi:hypothetical protein
MSKLRIKMDIFQIKQSVIAINFDWMEAIEMPEA